MSRYTDSGLTVTRGTTCPITIDIDTDLDLTECTVVFTMRAATTDTGDPIAQFDNEDSRMSVDEQTVVVTLTDSDTWAIPEKAVKVFVQVNVTDSDGNVSATGVYSMDVMPNIMEVSE